MDSKNVWKGLAYGGVASCIAEAITLPIDVVKTRLQLQGQLGAVRQYNGALDAFQKIVSKEGVAALWKGITPALFRQASYGSLRYGLYTPIKQVIGSADGKDSMLVKLTASAGSGALASAVANPTDLVKVRMQADGMDGGKGSKPRYTGFLHALKDIVANEGIAGLYKGVGPTCARATVLAAAELTTYDTVKTSILQHSLLPEGFGLHFTTALVAGFVSAWASSPFDVVKSRVMNQPVGPDGRGVLFAGMLDCFGKSIRSEGPLSLWKGIGPRVIIVFVVMEQLKQRFD